MGPKVSKMALHFMVPEGTTSIDADSLDEWGVDKETLEKVTIPTSVESIGCRAFSGCSALVEVTITTSVELIGDDAFNGCSALEEVAIPSSVKFIGDFAFKGCSALVKVAILAPVKSIGRYTFSGCCALLKVTIPASVESIGNCAFLECSALLEVAISLASIKSIAMGVFTSCHADLVLSLGAVADMDTPNRFPEINGVARCATLAHQLPGTASCCTVRRVWPASTDVMQRDSPAGTDGEMCSWPPLSCASHAATEPGPPTLVNGSGIVEPLQLQTPAGDEYMVHGCWGKDPVAHPDFKRLAAEQHPDALGNVGSWDVLLHNTDVASHTLDLAAVGDAVVRGEVNLSEPVLVIWTELEDAEGA